MPRRRRKRLAAGAVLVAATAAMIAAPRDPWEMAERVMWVDMNPPIEGAPPRAFSFRASAQHWAHTQWVPSRPSQVNLEDEAEVAKHAAAELWHERPVLISEALVPAPGCSEISMSVFSQTHDHDGGEPHRHRSIRSNLIERGECLDPPPVIVPEPERLELLAAGLLLLGAIGVMRRGRRG